MTRPQWWIFCDISFAAKTKALQVEKDKPVSKETNTPEKKVSNAAELKRWERHSRGCTMCTRLVLCAHILFQQGMIPPSHAAFTGHGSAIPCSVYRTWFCHPMQCLQGMVPPSHAAFTGHGSAITCSVYLTVCTWQMFPSDTLCPSIPSNIARCRLSHRPPSRLNVCLSQV